MATIKVPPVLRPSVGGEKEIAASGDTVGAGEPLVGRLLLYEALGATFTELKVRRDPECPICSVVVAPSAS